MRIKRRAHVTWEGPAATGTGHMSGRSGAFDVPYSVRSRTEDTANTNPEELIGAANAGCYAMSLANLLDEAGHPPQSVDTDAEVTMEQQDGRFSITSIALSTRVRAQGVDEQTVRELAERAKATCTVSRALAGTTITVEARLEPR